MLRRVIVLVIGLAAASVSLGAEDHRPADFTSAIKPLMSHLRSAAGYARNGNIAFAQIEIGDAANAWSQLQRKFSGAPPAPDRPAALEAFLATGQERLAIADRALGTGDVATASNELRILRRSYRELRRASGLYDLSDCIAEIAPAIEALRVATGRFSEEGASGRADATVAAASVFRDRLQRCNDWASADISNQPEFRRLIDGAIASSGEIARAAIAADHPLVHRYLIELQSYAQLLDFRFG